MGYYHSTCYHHRTPSPYPHSHVYSPSINISYLHASVSGSWKRRTNGYTTPFITSTRHLNLLMEKNNVDVNSRSFAIGWSSVLDPLCKIAADDDPHRVENNNADRYGAAVKCVDRVFVQRGHRPCIEDDVLRWPYAGCNIVTASTRE